MFRWGRRFKSYMLGGTVVGRKTKSESQYTVEALSEQNLLSTLFGPDSANCILFSPNNP